MTSVKPDVRCERSRSRGHEPTSFPWVRGSFHVFPIYIFPCIFHAVFHVFSGNPWVFFWSDLDVASTLKSETKSTFESFRRIPSLSCFETEEIKPSLLCKGPIVGRCLLLGRCVFHPQGNATDFAMARPNVTPTN